MLRCSKNHPTFPPPRAKSRRERRSSARARTSSIGDHHAERKVRAGHRLDLRHRPGHARALAAQGANVTINGFGDKAAIEKERAGIEKEFGVKAAYSPADMTKPAEIAGMVQTSEKTFGALDILVNNAGIQHVAPIEEFPIEKWDQIIAINLSSAFHTIRAAVPGMKSRKWGRIINTASAHSLVASPFKVGLRLGEAWACRPDQDGGARSRDLRHHRQLHQPRLCLDAAGREANSRHDEGARHDRGAGQARRAAGGAADQGIRHRRRGRRARGLSLLRRGEVDYRRQPFDRRRLDRGMSFGILECAASVWPACIENPLTSLLPGRAAEQRAAPSTKRINLALQGGGAHGAFTWGVLEQLLSDERLVIEGISGTSAGAVNAVMLADGLARGGPRGGAEAARRFLARGRAQRQSAGRCSARWSSGMLSFTPLEGTPMQAWFDALSRYFSPYDFNPLNINPLKDLFERFVDFEALRANTDLQIFISATNVQTGRVRIFSAREDHRRCRDGVGLPAAAVPRGRDRRRALLGRRLSRQSGDLSVFRHDQDRGCAGGADQSAGAAGDADLGQRDHESHQRNHVQLIAASPNTAPSISSPA